MTGSCRPGAAPIRALVVDDEPLARSNLLTLLERDSEIHVVGECRSGLDVVEAIVAASPDLVLLDIQMPECDGFEVLERVGPRLRSEVVFVTAHDAYAVQAFEAGALDYLVKPFTDRRFAAAIDRVKTRIRARHGIAPPRLVLKSRGRVTVAPVTEIDWVEAADHYTSVHIGGRAHLLRVSLARLERDLDPALFCRVHRSAIVNLTRVRAIAVNETGEPHVLLENGDRVRLSRRYRRRLHTRLGASFPPAAVEEE